MNTETLGNSMSPKMLRETLCTAQSALNLMAGQAEHPNTVERLRGHARTLGVLIAEIDVIRPLGSDGKHGDGERCTGRCGCLGRAGTWTLTP